MKKKRSVTTLSARLAMRSLKSTNFLVRAKGKKIVATRTDAAISMKIKFST